MACVCVCVLFLFIYPSLGIISLTYFFVIYVYRRIATIVIKLMENEVIVSFPIISDHESVCDVHLCPIHYFQMKEKSSKK